MQQQDAGLAEEAVVTRRGDVAGLSLSRGIVGAPSLKSYAEAREAADLHARSAVGCKPLLGAFRCGIITSL